ncbi:hypothetical protein [Liquorilactobacillus uvarum]|uniref:hypothetical protein n=1 Tax=Liquorilactobacillus uvarum TaxID=303240 RepID=UPI00288C21D6|nr:hypothetical protein [Liquorilactobacillus uvarum]
MNKNQLWQLTKINLLYANPQATSRARQSGKTGRKLTFALLRQYILIGVIFVALYGVTLLGFNLAIQTAVFTKFIALFTLMLVSQNISVINNVFFESNDQGAYLPLPFDQRTIYLAKTIVVQMANLSFAIPILWVFIMTSVHANNWFVSFFIAIILFILYLSLLFLSCTFVVFGLAQTKIFRQHQKMMTLLLLATSFVAMIAAIFLINNTSQTMSANQTGLLGFNLLHEILVNPLNGSSLFFLTIILTTVVLLAFLADRWLFPQLIVEHKSTRTIRKKNKRAGNSRSMKEQLIRYNLKLLQNPTLLMQNFYMTTFPFIMLGAGALSGDGSGISFEHFSLMYFGVFFISGIAISVLSIGPYSLTALGISLDRSNLFFIQTLPISFLVYLRLKFLTMWVLQTLYLLVLTTAVGFWLHITGVNFVALLLGVIWGAYLISLIYFVRDWRLRDLEWGNVTQLFNRGGGTLVSMLVVFGGMIVSGIIITGYFYLIKYTAMPWLINSFFGLIIFASSAGVIWKYQLTFWQKQAEITKN